MTTYAPFAQPLYLTLKPAGSTLTQMMYSEYQLAFGADKYNALPLQCLECGFLFACNGECPKNRFASRHRRIRIELSVQRILSKCS